MYAHSKDDDLVSTSTYKAFSQYYKNYLLFYMTHFIHVLEYKENTTGWILVIVVIALYLQVDKCNLL